MAARMGGLVDTETKKVRDGSLERIDDHTVRVNLPAADISLVAGMAVLVVQNLFDQPPFPAYIMLGAGGGMFLSGVIMAFIMQHPDTFQRGHHQPIQNFRKSLNCYCH